MSPPLTAVENDELEPPSPAPLVCRCTGTARAVPVAMSFVFVCVFGPIVIAEAVKQGGTAWFLGLWLAGAVFGLYHVLFRAVHRIDVDGERVVLRSIARQRSTTLSSIRSIETRWGGGPSDITIEFDGGKARLMGPMTGMSAFVTRVKAANPRVQLNGV